MNQFGEPLAKRQAHTHEGSCNKTTGIVCQRGEEAKPYARVAQKCFRIIAAHLVCQGENSRPEARHKGSNILFFHHPVLCIVPGTHEYHGYK